MKKIKWFLGEFFVVVAGVLVAFGLNGWYQGIRDQEKESKYLQEIRADLLATIENVESAEETQRQTVHTASQLLKASYSSILPTDSMLTRHIFGSMSFAPTAQVSAALSSLVSTGDLQLIGDDSLRSELGRLVSRLDEYTRTNNEMGYSWLFDSYSEFADVVNASDLRFQLLSSDMLASAAKDSLSGIPQPAFAELPERVNLYELIRKEDFRGRLLKLYIAQMNLFRVHVGFLEDLEGVLLQLEEAMESRGIAFQQRNNS